MAQHPKVTNRLFGNMVARRAELGGVLEVVLKRLAEFSEKAQKIKAQRASRPRYFIPHRRFDRGDGQLMILLMVFVVPKFKRQFLLA